MGCYTSEGNLADSLRNNKIINLGRSLHVAEKQVAGFFLNGDGIVDIGDIITVIVSH